MSIPTPTANTLKPHITNQPNTFILDGAAAPVNIAGPVGTEVELPPVPKVIFAAGITPPPPPLSGVGAGPTGKGGVVGIVVTVDGLPRFGDQ